MHTDTIDIHPDLDELRDILSGPGVWPAIRAEIPAWHPRNDGDDDGGGGGDDDDGGGDDDGDDDSGDGDDDDNDGGGDDDGDDGDDDDGDAASARAERDALKRRLDKAERARKKAERELKKRERADAEDDGEFKKLYEQEKARADGLEQKFLDGERDRAIVRLATKREWRNPSLAVKLIADELPDDVVDEEGDVDEKAIERALNAQEKEDKYLTRKGKNQSDLKPEDARRRRRDRDNGGGGGGGDDDVKPGMGRLRSAYADAEAASSS